MDNKCPSKAPGSSGKDIKRDHQRKSANIRAKIDELNRGDELAQKGEVWKERKSLKEKYIEEEIANSRKQIDNYEKRWLDFEQEISISDREKFIQLLEQYISFERQSDKFEGEDNKASGKLYEELEKIRKKASEREKKEGEKNRKIEEEFKKKNSGEKLQTLLKKEDSLLQDINKLERGETSQKWTENSKEEYNRKIIAEIPKEYYKEKSMNALKRSEFSENEGKLEVREQDYPPKILSTEKRKEKIKLLEKLIDVEKQIDCLVTDDVKNNEKKNEKENARKNKEEKMKRKYEEKLKKKTSGEGKCALLKKSENLEEEIYKPERNALKKRTVNLKEGDEFQKKCSEEEFDTENLRKSEKIGMQELDYTQKTQYDDRKKKISFCEELFNIKKQILKLEEEGNKVGEEMRKKQEKKMEKKIAEDKKEEEMKIKNEEKLKRTNSDEEINTLRKKLENLKEEIDKLERREAKERRAENLKEAEMLKYKEQNKDRKAIKDDGAENLRKREKSQEKEWEFEEKLSTEEMKRIIQLKEERLAIEKKILELEKKEIKAKDKLEKELKKKKEKAMAEGKNEDEKQNLIQEKLKKKNSGEGLNDLRKRAKNLKEEIYKLLKRGALQRRTENSKEDYEFKDKEEDFKLRELRKQKEGLNDGWEKSRKEEKLAESEFDFEQNLSVDERKKEIELYENYIENEKKILKIEGEEIKASEKLKKKLEKKKRKEIAEDKMEEEKKRKNDEKLKRKNSGEDINALREKAENLKEEIKKLQSGDDLQKKIEDSKEAEILKYKEHYRGKRENIDELENLKGEEKIGEKKLEPEHKLSKIQLYEKYLENEKLILGLQIEDIKLNEEMKKKMEKRHEKEIAIRKKEEEKKKKIEEALSKTNSGKDIELQKNIENIIQQINELERGVASQKRAENSKEEYEFGKKESYEFKEPSMYQRKMSASENSQKLGQLEIRDFKYERKMSNEERKKKIKLYEEYIELQKQIIKLEREEIKTSEKLNKELEKKREKDLAKEKNEEEKRIKNEEKLKKKKEKEMLKKQEEEMKKKKEEQRKIILADLKKSSDLKTRKENLLKFCKEIINTEKDRIPNPEPLVNSISNNCKDEKVVEALKKSDCSKLFMETTEEKEIQNACKQIEDITGFNPITGKESTTNFIKLQSKEIEKSKALTENLGELIIKFKEDLALIYGISPDKIDVVKVVPGSFEFYFKIAPGTNIRSTNFKEFNNVKNYVGQSAHSKMEVTEKVLIPDKEHARKLLKEYTKPLIIETKAVESELIKNFGDHLKILASMNSNVRVKHNENDGSLEIHGPPSQRAAILNYFAELQDILTGKDAENIVIIPRDNPVNLSGAYDQFIDALYEKAKKHTINTHFKENKLQSNTIRLNPNLKNGCPSFMKFLRALQKQKLDPKLVSVDQIMNKGTFGWHGTRQNVHVADIAFDGLSPARRSGQVYGTGEYCAEDPCYSLNNGYSGNTNTLILFFILKISDFYKFNVHHIVNNPPNGPEMYMVPILIATFNNGTPLNLTPALQQAQQQVNSQKFNWEWKGDSGWELYGKGQPIENDAQVIIEKMYQRYQDDKSQNSFLLTLVRIIDKNFIPYDINFQTMIQTNTATKYTRLMRRVPKT